MSQEELGIEPLLHTERSQLKWLEHMSRMPPGFRHVPPGGVPREDPGHAEETTSLNPSDELEELIRGEGSLGLYAWTAAPATQLWIKWEKMDEGMDGWTRIKITNYKTSETLQPREGISYNINTPRPLLITCQY